MAWALVGCPLHKRCEYEANRKAGEDRRALGPERHEHLSDAAAAQRGGGAVCEASFGCSQVCVCQPASSFLGTRMYPGCTETGVSVCGVPVPVTAFSYHYSCKHSKQHSVMVQTVSDVYVTYS